ncbi:MAG: ORF6N domain-containing protein [archaeon]
MIGNNLITQENIKYKIYKIRDTQVMLDRDLANLYEIDAIRLREQVKRNIARFTNKFMFQLNLVEIDFMVSQNVIPSLKKLAIL